MKEIIQREFEVAFSKHAQPVWFRIVKYLFFAALLYFLWDSPFIWLILGVLTCCAFLLHFYYRHKTRGWTQSYGMWNYEKNKPKLRQ